MWFCVRASQKCAATDWARILRSAWTNDLDESRNTHLLPCSNIDNLCARSAIQIRELPECLAVVYKDNLLAPGQEKRFIARPSDSKRHPTSRQRIFCRNSRPRLPRLALYVLNCLGGVCGKSSTADSWTLSLVPSQTLHLSPLTSKLFSRYLDRKRRHVFPTQPRASGHPAPVILRQEHARVGHFEAPQRCGGNLYRAILHYLCDGHIQCF